MFSIEIASATSVTVDRFADHPARHATQRGCPRSTPESTFFNMHITAWKSLPDLLYDDVHLKPLVGLFATNAESLMKRENPT
jgi:hypothetical protein